MHNVVLRESLLDYFSNEKIRVSPRRTAKELLPLMATMELKKKGCKPTPESVKLVSDAVDALVYLKTSDKRAAADMIVCSREDSHGKISRTVYSKGTHH